MPRKPDKRIIKAKELYKKGQKLIEIANRLGVPEGTVRSWKNRYKWDCNVAKEKRNVAKTKRGGQPGNKNATGPPGNKNAEKHGFFSKYLPEETFSIIQEIEKKGPLDILWENIQIAYAAIVRAQQIMYVKDHEDKTIEKIEEKEGNVIGEKWEVQQAWDKQATFL
ncbi:terminase, partial [Anaerobutyricum hallii]